MVQRHTMVIKSLWMGAAIASVMMSRASAGNPAGVASAPAAVGKGALPIGDAALYQGGLLIGQLYDADRRPLPQAEVSILAGDYTVATTRTDASGVFRVAGLRGGVHRIATANTVATYRLWAAGTAPPQAAPVLPLVVDGELARGQWSPPRPVSAFVESTREWRTNPFIVGGLVAAAVAIPVAIHNADDPPGS